MAHIEKKRVQCYGCGFETEKSFNFTTQRWSRKFKCPKCGSGSFQWYNY